MSTKKIASASASGCSGKSILFCGNKPVKYSRSARQWSEKLRKEKKASLENVLNSAQKTEKSSKHKKYKTMQKPTANRYDNINPNQKKTVFEKDIDLNTILNLNDFFMMMVSLTHISSHRPINIIKILLQIKKLNKIPESEINKILVHLDQLHGDILKTIDDLPPKTILEFVRGLPLGILKMLSVYSPIVDFEILVHLSPENGVNLLNEIKADNIGLIKTFADLDLLLILNILIRLKLEVVAKFVCILIAIKELTIVAQILHNLPSANTIYVINALLHAEIAVIAPRLEYIKISEIIEALDPLVMLKVIIHLPQEIRATLIEDLYIVLSSRINEITIENILGVILQISNFAGISDSLIANIIIDIANIIIDITRLLSFETSCEVFKRIPPIILSPVIISQILIGNPELVFHTINKVYFISSYRPD